MLVMDREIWVQSLYLRSYCKKKKKKMLMVGNGIGSGWFPKKVIIQHKIEFQNLVVVVVVVE